MNQHRSSLFKDDVRPAWQTSLDLLRLQVLPHARQVMQRCRAESQKEPDTPREARDAAGVPQGKNEPCTDALPEADEEKEGGANRILCKMAVRTGLSFFFFMLERDPEAKDFLLLSSTSFLADLKPLSLHNGLGTLEQESLAKVQTFLVKSAAEPQSLEGRGSSRAASLPFCVTSTDTSDNALSSLISLALALGSLGTNLILARLLYSNPPILKSQHLKQLRLMSTVSQTWSLDTPPSCSSRARIFRPSPGSAEEIIEAWELHVLPMLKACIPEEGARSEKWLVVVAALQARKFHEAKSIVSDLLASVGGTCTVGGVVFPCEDSVTKQREITPLVNDDCGMGAEKFLDHIECLLSGGGKCTGAEACAAVMTCLELLTRRLELPRIVPHQLVHQVLSLLPLLVQQYKY